MADARPDKPGSVLSVLIGLGSIILYIVLLIPVFVGSGYGGAMIAKAVGVPWIDPVFHGVVWIAGAVLVTWLMRVKLNRRPWSGVGLPRPQLGRLLSGAACGVGVILAIVALECALGWVKLSPLDASPTHQMPRLAWIALAL